MSPVLARFSWTQAICASCWVRINPDRAPVVIKQPERERCAYCGTETSHGIYVRDDPKSVPFPRREDD